MEFGNRSTFTIIANRSTKCLSHGVLLSPDFTALTAADLTKKDLMPTGGAIPSQICETFSFCNTRYGGYTYIRIFGVVWRRA